jgi:hypothetical protein
MVTYNDEEYENLLADDEGWSREETDHMFDLLERFDLRFIVVHDRWRGRGRPRHPACAGAVPAVLRVCSLSTRPHTRHILRRGPTRRADQLLIVHVLDPGRGELAAARTIEEMKARPAGYIARRVIQRFFNHRL